MGQIKIQELDNNRLAELLLRVPLASMHAHHKNINFTMEDYISPSDDNLEAQFVRDYLF